MKHQFFPEKADNYRQYAEGLRFIITGTGHCGSSFVAKVLSKLGVPTGHESIFRPTPTPNKGRFLGDSSMLAVPFLSQVWNRIIIHQIRDPKNFIRSMFTKPDLFAPHHAYGNFMRKHCPQAAQGLRDHDAPTLEWAAVYWLRWNQRIEPYRDHFFRLEDIDFVDILGWLGLSRSQDEIEEAIGAMTENDYHRHTNVDTPQIQQDLLEQLPIFQELQDYAGKYGYRV